ncbi:MAG: DUF4157 domain-containing protein [Bacteroidia bacterium]
MKQQNSASGQQASRSAAHQSSSKSQSLSAPGGIQLKDEKKKPVAQHKSAQLAAAPKKEKKAQAKMAGPAQLKDQSREVIGKMGEAMGADFSNVNIHEGNKASDVGALAYTQGNDIHFAQGKFDTASTSGKALLGHELAHVVQQREGRVQPTTSINGLPVNDSHKLESEADAIGNSVAGKV